MVLGHTISRLLSILCFITLLLVAEIGGSVQAAGIQIVTALPKISEIYPNAIGSSELGSEYIELVNMGSTDIDLSNYTLQIKDKSTKIMPLSGVLAAGEYKAFITTFTLVNGGETVQLTKGVPSEVIEEVAYGSGAAEDQAWSFFLEGWELAPLSMNLPNTLNPTSTDDTNPETTDICPATPEIDSIVPVGYEINSAGECVAIIAESHEECVVEISEISAQPNYLGKEYIEVINRGTNEASLKLCKISINGGTEKVVSDSVLAPNSMYVIPFSSGTIRNSAGTVLLVNSLNEEALYTYDDTLSGQVNNYASGSFSGSLSDHPTPGTSNINGLNTKNQATTTSANSLKPCAPGKFRNPATNRCKKIESSIATLQPCASDQFRNPETNRCKKVAGTTSALKPCNADQVRNPATNRCKKIGDSDSQLKPCNADQERNPETNRCRKKASVLSGTALAAAAEPAAIKPFQYKAQIIGAVLAALLAYGVYEYRTDIKNAFERIREKYTRGRPSD